MSTSPSGLGTEARLPSPVEELSDPLLTFGGAYSNHIRAVAAAGRACGFGTIGVIRGERHEPVNWSLRYAASQGMQLTYLDRSAYRHKHEPHILDGLRERFGDATCSPRAAATRSRSAAAPSYRRSCPASTSSAAPAAREAPSPASPGLQPGSTLSVRRDRSHPCSTVSGR